jgi:hypothetical protein
VHLEDERRVRADGVGVVAHRAAVRRTHLGQAGARGREQVRDAEAVADFDQLAPAHDDLAAGRQAECAEQQGCRVVVDHVHATRGRHDGGERGERTPAAPGALAAGQVELHIGRTRRGVQRGPGCVRQRRAAEVRVHDDPGRVDHRTQAGRPLGQRGDRGVGDLVGGDLAAARAVLSGGDDVLDRLPAEAFDRGTQLGHRE